VINCLLSSQLNLAKVSPKLKAGLYHGFILKSKIWGILVPIFQYHISHQVKLDYGQEKEHIRRENNAYLEMKILHGWK
jgi:hypothetical protein